MGLAYVLVGVLSAAVAVFVLQNPQTIPLRFVVWTLNNVPLAGAVLGALATGLILATVPLSIELWRWRARARALDAKVDMLESALTTRDAALLTPRPAPAPAPMPSARSA
jgi:uncharacterized integral membrane protein